MKDKIFYKYRDISDRTEDILKNKKIWLAKPNTLNDPYECKIREFTRDECNKEVEQSMSNQLMGFIMTLDGALRKGEPIFGLRQKDVKSIMKSIKKASSLKVKYEIANNVMTNKAGKSFSNPSSIVDDVDYVLDNVGVFSLSEDPLNMLMWSHYSYNHQGIALGFDFEDSSILNDGVYFKPINYTDEPLSFDLSDGKLVEHTYYYNESMELKSKMSLQFIDPQLQKIFFTKTTDWAYEKEWRYVRENFGSYDFPSKLSRIIFGLNCPEEDIENIISLCDKNYDYDLEYFQIKRVYDSKNLELKKLGI